MFLSQLLAPSPFPSLVSSSSQIQEADHDHLTEGLHNKQTEEGKRMRKESDDDDDMSSVGSFGDDEDEQPAGQMEEV